MAPNTTTFVRDYTSLEKHGRQLQVRQIHEAVRCPF